MTIWHDSSLCFAIEAGTSRAKWNLSKLTGSRKIFVSPGERQTHQSRQPSRVVGIMSSAMSLPYAMAGSFIEGMNLDGRLQPAGLDISTVILWDEAPRR